MSSRILLRKNQTAEKLEKNKNYVVGEELPKQRATNQKIRLCKNKKDLIKKLKGK